MILFVNACVRDESRTKYLADYLLNKLDDEIVEFNLQKMDLKPLNSELLKRRDMLILNKNFDNDFFKYPNIFKKSDTIVIASPYYDLSFSALLKIFIENMNIGDLTFKYENDGNITSLIKCKKLYYITTAGGNIINDSYGYGYIKEVFSMFYGVKDIEYIKAEGLDIYGNNPDEIMKIIKNKIDKDYN